MSDTDIDQDNPSSLSSELESSQDSISSEDNHRSKIRSRRRSKLVKVEQKIRNKVAVVNIDKNSSGSTDTESDYQDKETQDDPEARPDDKKLLIGYALCIGFLVVIAIVLGSVLAWQNNSNDLANDEATMETGKTTGIPTRPMIPTSTASSTTTKLLPAITLTITDTGSGISTETTSTTTTVTKSTAMSVTSPIGNLSHDSGSNFK